MVREASRQNATGRTATTVCRLSACEWGSHSAAIFVSVSARPAALACRPLPGEPVWVLAFEVAFGAAALRSRSTSAPSGCAPALPLNDAGSRRAPAFAGCAVESVTTLSPRQEREGGHVPRER